MSRLLSGVVAAILLAASASAVSAQSAPAAAARLSPRDAVLNIAAAIEANYFDAAKGKAIADELRAAAGKGAFDRFADPRELIVELNARLKPKDAHFNVDWSGEAPAAATGRPAGPPPDFAAELRRRNYGIVAARQLPGNVGLIDMRMFAHIDFDDPNDPAKKAIDAALLLTSGSDALIIDLRDNGGGSPAMVGYLASAFTPRGADIYNTFLSREGTDTEAPRVPYATPNLTQPVYILISGRTGSAAEAFAYTMKNAGRAVIVGEPSAGAANPGDAFRVAGGFRVFVSTGSPVSPITKTNWEGTGVTPDVVVPSVQALDAAQKLALTAAMQAVSGPYRVENQWALDAISPPQVQVRLADFPGAYGEVRVSVEEGGLRYARGRRPPWDLYPVAEDTFAIRGDPSRRVRFLRDGQGRVVALEVLSPEGRGGLYRRAQ